MKNKKELGQHWLKDRDVLSHIADLAEIQPNDTVLEIGPGLGTLTSELLRRAKRVVAVEFDESLAAKLPAQFPGKDLEVLNEDILTFDLGKLPTGYVVAANIPYYITNQIVKTLMTAENKPRVVVLLVQKEVAERLAAGPGDMSILSVSAQVFAEVSLGDIVPARLFTPPPKVDSQVVVLKLRAESFLAGVDESKFFRVVRAGFSAKRKKLRTSLSGGLGISKQEAEKILESLGVDPGKRAEELGIEDWLNLTRVVKL